MKEITRVATVQVTYIAKNLPDRHADLVEETTRADYRRIAREIELCVPSIDDAVVLDVKTFVREVDEDGNV